MKRISFFIFFFCFSFTNLFAQVNTGILSSATKGLAISPELSIGYTFQGTVNFGFTVDFGYQNFIRNDNFTGVSFNYRIMKYYSTYHHHRSWSVFYQNNYFDAKIGIGRTRAKSTRRRTSCNISGVVADIGINYPHKFSPKIGYNHFYFNERRWGHFPSYYKTIYLSYALDPILFQK